VRRAAPLDLFVFEELARRLRLPAHSWSICLFASDFIQLAAPATRPAPFGFACHSCQPVLVNAGVHPDEPAISAANGLADTALVAQNLQETQESWRIQIKNARQQFAIEGNVPESLERQSLNRFAQRLASRRPGTADTLVVCVTGPGAGGKDTILRHLGTFTPRFRRLIHVSTRAARSNETGDDRYEFISEEEFKALEERGELFAVRNIAGRGRYAIRRSAVMPVCPRYLIKESARGMEQLVTEIATLTPRVAHLLIYLCPPEPIFDTLLSRAHSRAIQGNEQESVFYNTLRPFNSILFADMVARVFRDENVVVVVNDKLKRALSTIENAIQRMCGYVDAGRPSNDVQQVE
jgi:guanylate kinase